MAPRKPDYERNRAEEQANLDTYEQSMSEKANILTELSVNLRYVQRDVGEMKSDIKTLKGEFVTKDELDSRIKLIERLVYGMVALVGAGLITAFLNLIVKR